MEATTSQPTLVLSGTGKTGRRVVERLEALGRPVRVGTPSTTPPFDRNDPATWPSALAGVGSVYLTYYPDLAVPGTVEAVRSFAELAVRGGATRLALLSGRGEPEVERAEQAVAATEANLTILRSTWFMQNCSEDYMSSTCWAVSRGCRPARWPTPFVDAGDIADVAVAALTHDRHVGQLYELTGPRSLTMAEAAAEIAQASGRQVRYVPVSLADHAAEAAAHGVPPEVVELLTYLFREVMDGRNAATTDDVRRALGRDPPGFTDYTRGAATTGVWNASAAA
jgi:uncharacterized protein YbjT (DUF2867 family)